jgi:hypothetical protein
MASSTTPPESTPNRNDVIADSYAIHVDERRISVWQYRIGISAPDGEWRFVEMFDYDEDPKLTVERATLTSPTKEGYWIYSRFYDCHLDCE